MGKQVSLNFTYIHVDYIYHICIYTLCNERTKAKSSNFESFIYSWVEAQCHVDLRKDNKAKHYVTKAISLYFLCDNLDRSLFSVGRVFCTCCNFLATYIKPRAFFYQKQHQKLVPISPKFHGYIFPIFSIFYFSFL